MKHLKTMSFIAGIVFSLSSCYTTHLVDDDVYRMKDANVQIGETLTDETSYATFKDRTHKNERVNSYYSTRERFDADPLWNTWNNYYFLNRNYRSSIGFIFDPFYRNHFGGFNNFGFNNLGIHNFSYGSHYGFYGNNAGFNNQNNSFFGGSFNSSEMVGGIGGINGANTVSNNVIVGPRGSMSGIANSSSLGNQMMLKNSRSNRLYSSGNNTAGVLNSVKNDRSQPKREILSPVDKSTNRTATSHRSSSRTSEFGYSNGRGQSTIIRSGNSGRIENSSSPSRQSGNTNSQPVRTNSNAGPRRNK